jgi:aryl-alcohol dehydrogenase-like predicted oxidoreductase
MKKRVLGKTGIKLSIVGFGGGLLTNETQGLANHYVAQAIERGINYFDVSPVYGNAEELLGLALKPYRESVFLACKTRQRTADTSKQELIQSLQNLKTDHFDLYQFHELKSTAEVDTITSAGGALETFQQAKKDGLINHIGFSAHSEEAALAIMDRFDFDSMLFPFNWTCWFQKDFGPRVLKKAQEQEIGRLALKSLAKRNWKENEQKRWLKCWYAPVETQQEASLVLRFTLSLPITAAVSANYMEFLLWACDCADSFTPITDAEKAALQEKSRDLDAIFPEKEAS